MLRIKPLLIGLAAVVSMSACTTMSEEEKRNAFYTAEVKRMTDEMYSSQKIAESRMPKLAEPLNIASGEGRPNFDELPISYRNPRPLDKGEIILSGSAYCEWDSEDKRYSKAEYETLAIKEWNDSSCVVRKIGKSQSGTVFFTCYKPSKRMC